MAKQDFLKSLFLGKKGIFILGLVLLTIGLVFFFRQQGLKFYIDQQRENIADFYAQNLEPLFSKSQLSKEDIFNFAFYKELPIDKKNNKVLQLGDDNEGKEFFEFRNARYNPKTNNLEQFAGIMDLNGRQKQQLDSVLNSYKDKIQTQVLVNDRNTMAINSNLWNLNRALMADLLLFSSRANKDKFRKIFTEDFYAANVSSIPQMVSEVKSFDNNKYIFIRSDTIYTKEYNFDEVKLDASGLREKDEPSVRIRFDNDLAKVYGRNSAKRNNFTVKIDSNYFRVQLPDIPEVPERNNPEIHRINTELEKAASRLRNISVKFHTPVPPLPPGVSRRHRTTAWPDSMPDFEMNISILNVDSIVQTAFRGSLELLKNMNIQINLDSLDLSMQGDSTMTPEERAELKKEMKKLKIQLNKMKKNIKARDSHSNGSE